MQDTELFLSLAEIAGVFVGFGALIAVRGGGASGAYEVTYIRGVVWMGVVVVVAALAPVIISRFGVTGHDLWLVCSLLAAALFWGMRVVTIRTPEHRAVEAPLTRAETARELLLMLAFEVPWLIALIVVVLGLFPGQEPALYLAAVTLILFEGAYFLVSLVLSLGRPQTAPDPAALPGTGGSSA
jgi:hypothetical protein